MRRIFKEGKYEQRIEMQDSGEIISATCTCRWDTMEESRFETKEEAWLNKRLCKHLKEFLKSQNG